MLTNIKPIGALSKLAKEKGEKNLKRKVPSVSLEDAKSHGWKVEKTQKNGSTQMIKPKPYGTAIADRIWSVLYNMKFLYMNGEDTAQLRPEMNTRFDQNVDIDIVGIDCEVAVAVFLKTSPEAREADEDFHQELDLYASAQQEFAHAINSTYKPAEQRANIKTALVVFACNIHINENDRKFAKAKSITIFDENDLEYYEELVKHLGDAAKYQFLADLLENTEIPALNIEVPAIRLKVGKIVYYSFAIYPEDLLKISYIAHRVRGKKADDQAYQRMAEKQRMAEMREYISKPAIFPTNIVINLKKKPRFDGSKFQVSKEQGELGTLKLKNMYKSAWIIDGQHRLYSYSGHSESTKSLLSVLAFEELPDDQQMEFFVDINSKQKRVAPAHLQQLFGQVNKDASDPADRIKSIITEVISLLDDNRDSAFYQRIKSEGTKGSSKRCITSLSIFSNISEKTFTHHESGILCVKGDDAATKERIIYIVNQWFTAIKKEVLIWWDAGNAASSGGLAMNDSVSACFIVLRNVFQDLISKQNNLVSLGNQELTDRITPYASIISKYLATLTKEERQAFRLYGRGTQGQTQRARTLLLAIRKEIPGFSPPTLKEHRSEENNQEAKALLADIKQLLLEYIINTLQDQFGEEEQKWWGEGIPYTTQQIVLQRYETARGPEDKEKYLDFQDYIAIFQAHWNLFKDAFGHSSSPRYSANHIAWLHNINDIQDLVDQDKTVSAEQLDKLGRDYEWLRGRFSL